MFPGQYGIVPPYQQNMTVGNSQFTFKTSEIPLWNFYPGGVDTKINNVVIGEINCGGKTCNMTNSVVDGSGNVLPLIVLNKRGLFVFSWR